MGSRFHNGLPGCATARDFASLVPAPDVIPLYANPPGALPPQPDPRVTTATCLVSKYRMLVSRVTPSCRLSHDHAGRFTKSILASGHMFWLHTPSFTLLVFWVFFTPGAQRQEFGLHWHVFLGNGGCDLGALPGDVLSPVFSPPGDVS